MRRSSCVSRTSTERAARTGLWRLLTRLSEERPLLITADDSDEMDPASLAVVAFALGRMDSQAVAALTSADGHGGWRTNSRDQ